MAMETKVRPLGHLKESARHFADQVQMIGINSLTVSCQIFLWFHIWFSLSGVVG